MFRRYLKWAARDATLIEQPVLEEIVDDKPLDSTEMSIVVPLEADQKNENLNDLLVHMNGERICLVYLGRAYETGQVVRFRLTHHFANREGNSDHWLVASPRFVEYENFHLTLRVPEQMATPDLLFFVKTPAGDPVSSHSWAKSPNQESRLAAGMNVTHDTDQGVVQADWEVNAPVMNNEYIISYHRPIRSGSPLADSPVSGRFRRNV
jgi:hypothetical protein